MEGGAHDDLTRPAESFRWPIDPNPAAVLGVPPKDPNDEDEDDEDDDDDEGEEEPAVVREPDE